MRVIDQLRTYTRPGVSGWVPYVISALFVLASFVTRLALGPWIEGRSPLAIFFPAVILSAGLYGVGPGLFAMVLSLIVASWAFIGPSAKGFSSDALVSMGVFLATGQFMLMFANHLRSARQRSISLEA